MTELPDGLRLEERVEYAYNMGGKVTPIPVCTPDMARDLINEGWYVYVRTIYTLVDDRPLGRQWDYFEGRKPK